jgi:hypothetical protein
MNNYGYSVGFLDLLLLLFIGLKLAGVISWSWWWVFAPVWIPLVILAITIILAGGAILVKGIFFKGRN